MYDLDRGGVFQAPPCCYFLHQLRHLSQYQCGAQLRPLPRPPVKLFLVNGALVPIETRFWRIVACEKVASLGFLACSRSGHRRPRQLPKPGHEPTCSMSGFTSSLKAKVSHLVDGPLPWQMAHSPHYQLLLDSAGSPWLVQ